MFHWKDASKDQCKAFYGFVKRYVQDRAIVWMQFLDDAYEEMSDAKDEKRPHASDGDRHSFSKGELSRIIINLVWRWLQKHEPDYVSEIEASLRLPFDGLEAPITGLGLMGEKPRPKPPLVTWRRFLDDHAVPNRVDVRLMKPRPEPEAPQLAKAPTADGSPTVWADAESQSSVAPPETWPLSETTVCLGEAFYFEFTPDVSGSVLAFQRTGYPWWEPLPINGQDAYIDDVGPISVVPHDDIGNALPLLESDRAGPHDFVFVQAPMALLSPTIEAVGGSWQVGASELDDLAKRLVQSQGQWTLMRLRVRFRT